MMRPEWSDTRNIPEAIYHVIVSRAQPLHRIGGLVAVSIHPVFADEKTFAFSGARIIDGNGGPPIENGILVVDGDRVAAVGVVGEIPIPKQAEVVDLTGRTVIPGLISAHSHLGLVHGASAASPENYTRENVSRQVAQSRTLRSHRCNVPRMQ